MSCAVERSPRSSSGDARVPHVADRLGITSPETLRRWVRQAEADRGLRQAPTTEELAEIKALRKEVADQQRTIEILKAATSFFVQEANPRSAVRIAFIDVHRVHAGRCRPCARRSGWPSGPTTPPRPARPRPAVTADSVLKVEIRRVFESNWSCYGARRVWLALRRDNIDRRPLHGGTAHGRDGHHEGYNHGKKRYTTRPDATATRPPDLVERRLVAGRPDELLACRYHLQRRPGRAGCTCRSSWTC